MTNKINIKDEDQPISKRILDLYEYSKLNWQQVVLQSITYNEDYIKQQNNIKDSHNVNYLSYVHPVKTELSKFIDDCEKKQTIIRKNEKII